eukprot:1443-Heterococcus_DN1.PRE.8
MKCTQRSGSAVPFKCQACVSVSQADTQCRRAFKVYTLATGSDTYCTQRSVSGVAIIGQAFGVGIIRQACVSVSQVNTQCRIAVQGAYTCHWQTYTVHSQEL